MEYLPRGAAAVRLTTNTRRYATEIVRRIVYSQCPEVSDNAETVVGAEVGHAIRPLNIMLLTMEACDCEQEDRLCGKEHAVDSVGVFCIIC